ncbi:MAG: plastocyanin/azurin family copper-binding protein [Pirellulales bacterium]
MKHASQTWTLLFVISIIASVAQGRQLESANTPKKSIYAEENLVAWCIVPFDAKKRGPAERAEMLVELGVKKCAYDWREEHVATFEEEILQYKKHGIDFFAFWSQHEAAFALFEKYDLHPQIWQIIGDPGGDAETKVQRAAERLVGIASRTQKLKCPLGLYNHMGWDGEPENMVAVCKRLRDMGFEHVGIVYNFHHGHDHIARWQAALKLMQPYLLCVNINGMNDTANPKILGLGKGKHERSMLQVLLDSGYNGPVGIIDHRPELDARESLLENLDGLKKLRSELIDKSKSQSATKPSKEDDANVVKQLLADAIRRGNADRGAAVFGSDQTACVSCHQISSSDGSLLGGVIGPDLRQTLKQRNGEQIVESLLWPDRVVDEKFRTWQVLTADGNVHSGFKLSESNGKLKLKDFSKSKDIEIDLDDVEQQKAAGSPMPAALMSQMTGQQQLDLLAFLIAIKKTSGISDVQFQSAKQAHSHGAASFPITKTPIEPNNWPNHKAFVNRDRIYDFYTKQAEYFRGRPAPVLLAQFPGLDGGAQGHWGNQNEKTWEDGRWSKSILGSMQSGVLRIGKETVTRAICLQLGETNQLSCCFDIDTLSYRVAWKNGFVGFSNFRHGFIDGMKPIGEMVEVPRDLSQAKLGQYVGLYRIGPRVVFEYMVDGKRIWDSPAVENGQLTSETSPAEKHSLYSQVQNAGSAQWPNRIDTSITLGNQHPFAIDNIQLPIDNPWKALIFPGGHDFLPDGSALVCTMQGDVWHVQGLEQGSTKASWKRFASGLHHPLDLLVDKDGIFVQCRDQLVRLVDMNGDQEADFYQCFSKAFETSPAGHDYICGLQRDSKGNFYTATGNQGLVRISPDGKNAELIATGFRNPDGLGILPDDTVTVPCSEGEWTPASMICAVKNASALSVTQPLHFGYRGPKSGKAPELPLVYLPRGMDNSSGGQCVVPNSVWGAMSNQLLHLSFGAGSWFSVLVDNMDEQLQGALIPLAGDFNSSVHRGRFNSKDKSFYVCGMHGWGAYTVDDGCFQRVRYSGEKFQQPVAFHAHRNGVVVKFAEPVDRATATNIQSHFAQCWNYRYSGAYGSSEYSPSHPGVEGHDSLAITQVALIDERTLFFEIPDIQPVNQLHLRMHVNPKDQLPTANPTGAGHDLLMTIHKLDRDFTNYDGYESFEKTIAAHPMLVDLAIAAVAKKNPWLTPTGGTEQSIEIQTGKNLTYQQSELRVKAGTAVALTLSNPDVVPHNWVLVQPNKLNEIGDLANRMISSPEAYARHYVPDSNDVLYFTDIIGPDQKQTIHFKAPSQPGKYPYLCTFPGHWMVMNGLMIVE